MAARVAPGLVAASLASALAACPWSRADCLRPQALQEHGDELALLESLDNGKTYTQAGFAVVCCCRALSCTVA